jgi:spermidine synthase
VRTLHTNGPVVVAEQGDERGLFVNDKCQGRVNKHNLEPVSPYILETLALIRPSKPRKALFLGGGACLIPTALQKEFKTYCTIVEPSNEIFNLACDYFGHKGPSNFVELYGETYLAEYYEHFELCVLDAYNGLERVTELYNVKVYEQLRDMCKEVAINFISLTKLEADLHIEILKDTFKNLKVVPIQTKKPYQYIFYGH